MSKRAPSTTQLLVIAGFALSCFGILLFLWITFGGPTPFKAKTYEIKVPFNEATQLAQQSDVRISGVSVGKVQDIVLAPNGKQALAKVEIDDKYAPIPRGHAGDPAHQDAARRDLHRTDARRPQRAGASRRRHPARGQHRRIGPARRDLPHLQPPDPRRLPDLAAGSRRRRSPAAAPTSPTPSASSNPTFTQFDRIFRVLDSQRLAVNRLFRNGATSLEALRGRQGELAGLIRNSNAVFSTTAARDRDIEALFRAFPTFQDESRLTLNRLKTFALDADPVMQQLVPVAEQLSPTLVALSKLAPQAKGFFEGLEPVIDRAPTGFPALRKLFRDQFPPLLRAVDPFLRNLNPVITGLGLYKHELTATMANVASMSNAILTTENAAGEHTHYIRAMGPFSPESLATYPSRTTTNRTNAYPQPLATKALASGLPSFDTRGCTLGRDRHARPRNGRNSEVFKARTKKGSESRS